MIRKIVKLVFGLSVAFCASAVLYFGITDKGTPQQEAVAQAATRLTCRPHMAEASDHEWPSPAVVHAAHRCRDAGSPGVSLVRIADWSRASNPDAWAVTVVLNGGNELTCFVPDNRHIQIKRDDWDLITPLPYCKP